MALVKSSIVGRRPFARSMYRGQLAKLSSPFSWSVVSPSSSLLADSLPPSHHRRRGTLHGDGSDAYPERDVAARAEAHVGAASRDPGRSIRSLILVPRVRWKCSA